MRIIITAALNIVCQSQPLGHLKANFIKGIVSCFFICLVILGNILAIVITIVKTLDSVISFQRVLMFCLCLFVFFQLTWMDFYSKVCLPYGSDFLVLGVLFEGCSKHV